MSWRGGYRTLIGTTSCGGDGWIVGALGSFNDIVKAWRSGGYHKVDS